MNGQQPPIPGCNASKIAARRDRVDAAHFADVRPDVTQQGAIHDRARAVMLANADIVRYRQARRLRVVTELHAYMCAKMNRCRC
jgi:hypothetical protein